MKEEYNDYTIRLADPKEYHRLGEMTVQAYQSLPGMPGPKEQTEYYAMLKDVAGRATQPSIEIWAAVDKDSNVLGGITFVGDMAEYNSGGSAGSQTDCAGVRLLAVKPEARGKGVGRALTLACIQRAKEIGRSLVVLHTTKSMETAWRLYQSMGFVRSPNLDFEQGRLEVYGFSLPIEQKGERI